MKILISLNLKNPIATWVQKPKALPSWQCFGRHRSSYVPLQLWVRPVWPIFQPALSFHGRR